MALQLTTLEHYVPHGGIEDVYVATIDNPSGGHYNILSAGAIFGFNGKTYADLIGSGPFGWTGDSKTQWRFSFKPDATTDYYVSMYVLYEDGM